MHPYQSNHEEPAAISIIGIGGAGANVLQAIDSTKIAGVGLYCTALDTRLNKSEHQATFIQLGSELHHGLATGGDPILGKTAALQELDKLQTCVLNRRLVILVCGLGGGTGSGVAPVLAEMAELAGAMVVALVIMPFDFEGSRRREQAEQALSDIHAHANFVLCFENDEMEDLVESYGSAHELFQASASMIAQATCSLPMIAMQPGIINIGLDELERCLTKGSSCLFASAEASGEQRVAQVIEKALKTPMMKGAHQGRMGNKLLVHLVGSDNLKLAEIKQVFEQLREKLAPLNTEIFFGLALQPNMQDALQLSLFASAKTIEKKSTTPSTANFFLPEEEEEDDDNNVKEKEEATPAAEIKTETAAEQKEEFTPSAEAKEETEAPPVQESETQTPLEQSQETGQETKLFTEPKQEPKANPSTKTSPSQSQFIFEIPSEEPPPSTEGKQEESPQEENYSDPFEDILDIPPSLRTNNTPDWI